jgi:hypothetical protein
VPVAMVTPSTKNNSLKKLYLSGKPKFASRKTLIKSDSLDFDLQPNIDGNVGKSPAVKVQQDKPGKGTAIFYN